MGNGCLDQLMLAENPLVFQVLYLIKYIGNFTYFIWDAMVRLLKTSGLASDSTNLSFVSLFPCIWQLLYSFIFADPTLHCQREQQCPPWPWQKIGTHGQVRILQRESNRGCVSYRGFQCGFCGGSSNGLGLVRYLYHHAKNVCPSKVKWGVTAVVGGGVKKGLSQSHLLLLCT